MKKRISIAVLGVGVLATPCFALFLVFDPSNYTALGKILAEDVGLGAKLMLLTVQSAKMIEDGLKMYQKEEEIRKGAETAFAITANPKNWRGAIAQTTTAMGTISNGYDEVALRRINGALATAKEALEIDKQNPHPTAEQVATFSALTIQQVKAKNEADQLQAELKIQEDIRIAKERELWGCISCTRRSAK